jgi:hypothetical protein
MAMTGSTRPAEVARQRRRDAEWPTLLAGAGVALWGWRLEVGVGGVLVAGHVWLSGLVSVLAASVLIGLAVAGVIAVPRQRRWFVRVLLAARVRRRWRRAWMDCGLLPVRAGRIRSVPAGELMGHSPAMTLGTYAHVIRELKGEPVVSAEKQVRRDCRKLAGRFRDAEAAEADGA